MSGAPVARVIQIHGHAVDQLVEQLKRNVEALGGVAHGQKHGIVDVAPPAALVPCCEPRIEAAPALLARQALVVGQIVGLAHEGVDGADGVAALKGQRDEGVIEILGFALGDLRHSA